MYYVKHGCYPLASTRSTQLQTWYYLQTKDTNPMPDNDILSINAAQEHHKTGLSARDLESFEVRFEFPR